MTHSITLPVAQKSELARFWPAVVASFMTAVFGWGFGFTGVSVYLAELQHLRGWPTALIASSITTYYLLGALFLTQVHVVLPRIGPARLLASGVVLLGLGASWFSRARQPWEMFGAAVLMAAGWAGCTSTAISVSLAQYFNHQRGLAITLALNGASAAGFIVAPVLAALSQRFGVNNAVPIAACAGLLVVLPLIATSFPVGGRIAAAPSLKVDHQSTGALLQGWRFWSIALPFALALVAQVGMIVHLISLLRPTLGPAGSATALALTSVAAVSGRLVLAGVIDRLPRRPAAAISIASQAAGLGLMLAFPTLPAALYAGCIIFGLSVGNVITYPALIVQHEFPGFQFAKVVGLSTAVGQSLYALSPALLGAIRDFAGSYAPVLMLCIGFQLAAALLVARAPRASATAPTVWR